MKYEVIQGDCLEVMRGMDADSVDAIVTDPPYGLSFMGKKWDYDVPSVEIWAECLRVLRPGGHLLAFAGTRTQHRMSVRIEDAGFEIRDMIAWVYGSGFPKSLDVSKAIDKMDASEEQERRRLRFTAWVRSTGATARQIDDATGTNMGGHYTTAASQPAIMTREHLDACRHLLGAVPEWVEREADIRSVESKNFAERELVGRKTGLDGSGFGNVGHGLKSTEIDITDPATAAAREWHGWGTALKPALEPITVARKPLVGTVAANVMQHGTGALNIDGCRVGTLAPTTTRGANALGRMNDDGWTPSDDGQRVDPHPAGRWPANLIHDGGEEATAPMGESARFFYCAKASKRDREDGLDGVAVGKAGVGDERPSGGSNERMNKGAVAPRSNTHPTVKPTDLMRYLCRLVTPPNGVVLDPFAGSGSTGRGAVLEGFRFVGIEREAEYAEIARRRIAKAQHDA
jgi:DNA modification methylase